MSYINLSPHKVDHSHDTENIAKILRRIAIGTLFIVVLIISTLFVINHTTPLPSLKNQESNVLTNLTFLRQKAVKIYLIRDRVQSVQNISSSRSMYEALLKKVKDQLPDDVSVATLGIKKNLLQMTITSSSLASLNSLLDQLTAMVNKKDSFKKLTISSIDANPESGKYSIDVIAEIL